MKPLAKTTKDMTNKMKKKQKINMEELIEKLDDIYFGLDIQENIKDKALILGDLLECINVLKETLYNRLKLNTLLYSLDILSDKQRKLYKYSYDCEYEALMENIANKDK